MVWVGRFRIYRAVLTLSSFPLAVLLYLMIMSGYGLIDSKDVEVVTLGLINYPVSAFLHTHPAVRLALVASATAHALSGFSLMTLRIRRKYLRVVAEAVVWILTAVFLTQVLFIEFH